MGNQALFENEDKYGTEIGFFDIGKRSVMHGHDIQYELSHLKWLEMLFFSITQRKLEPDEAEILNFAFAIAAFPDIRLWPNRIMSYAGSYRSSSVSALASAIATSDARYYGTLPSRYANDFYRRAHHFLKEKGDNDINLKEFILREIKERKYILGFGRPLAPQDERIPPTIKKLKDLGWQNKIYINLVFRIQSILKAEKNITLSYGGLYAAIGTELGLNPDQFYLLSSIVFLAGVFPCYFDSLSKKEGTFLPVRCEDIIPKDKPMAFKKWRN